jgi:hypothetical protein
VAPLQLALQAPQFCVVSTGVSQPTCGPPSQCAYPGSHALASNAHAPAMQATEPLTCGSRVQSFGHPPQ